MGRKRSKSEPTLVPDENKADKFVRVVTPRINKAVKAINTVGYCSSKAYEYTPKQIEQITQVLFAAINVLIDSYASQKKSENAFAFPE